MRRVTWRTHGLTLSLCVPLLLAAPVASLAEVLQWVDENGVTHYTIQREDASQQMRRRLHEAAPAPVASEGEDAVEAPFAPLQRTDFGPEGDPSPWREDAPEPAPLETLGETEDPVATPAPAPTRAASLRPDTPEPAYQAPEVAAPGPGTGTAPRTAGPDDAYPRLAQGSARIAELEADIARDRESLRRRISEGKGQGIDLARDPQVREIAKRLPRLQSELAELRAKER